MHRHLKYVLSYGALFSAFCGFVYVVNNFITYIYDMPGLFGMLELLGLPFKSPHQNYNSIALAIGLVQMATYLMALYIPFKILRSTDSADRHRCCEMLSSIMISAAFWSVLLIGSVDASISFLRIENMLPHLIGENIALALGKPQIRGQFIHIPLMLTGVLIALYHARHQLRDNSGHKSGPKSGIPFIWLALLIVYAELLIVITRFIFSYEQAFMGDLVRFWYAALFLFASAYTLAQDGHVRVDVLYAHFAPAMKAKTNLIGALILGMPLCWVILMRGLWHSSSPFNLALLNFEITQQGFGMYVKYIMSSFLVIFALSMLFQFASLMLTSLHALEATPPKNKPHKGER